MEALTVKEAAQAVRISEAAMRRVVDAGELRYFNVGSPARVRIRIDRADLEAWFETRASRPADKAAS